MMIRCLSTVVFSAVLIWGSVSPAQQTESADVSSGNVSRMTTEISNEVYSPFCPGKTLAMCPSPAAAEVRRDIQKMAEGGLKKEDIKTRIIEEYGDEFRLDEPPLTDNLGLLGLVAFGLFLAFFAVWIISRRTGRDSGDAGRSKASPDEGPAADGALDESTQNAQNSEYLDALRDEYRG